MDLKRGLRAEQKRGFDAKLGLLNTIASTLTQLALSDRVTPWGPDTRNHPSAVDALRASDSVSASAQTSGSFKVGEARVGFCDVGS